MREGRSQKLFPVVALFPRSLRAKFILVLVVVQVVVMGLVTLVVEQRQRDTILHESRQRALSLATSLAALSEGYLLSYNFVKLEQTAEQMAAREPNVAYVIIHLHNGQVATYSGYPEKQGQVLEDAVSQRALQAESPFVQEIATAAVGGKGYDVTIPVFAQGGTRKWGTIRIGFSLAHALGEIRKTSQGLVLLGLIAILLETGGAMLLAMRISKPIRQLVTSVNEVARGNYDYSIAVTSRDEVGHLAQRFEEMRKALRLHVTSLAEETRRLEWTNRTLRETQNQLVQYEKLAAVGKLAARVAHEVNNPLAIIKTSFYMLNEKLPTEDPSKEELVIIKEELDRIARIIRQLLDFARPQSDITTLHVNDTIQNLVKFVEKDLLEHHIRVVLSFSSEQPVVWIAPDHFKQVLLNLIKNAQEAMPTGGTLAIATAVRQGEVLISVADDGVGIAETHLRSIFEPFFSTKKHGEGMGLGLAVSDNIVKSYGGAIAVESQLAKGTVFHIALPATSANVVRRELQREWQSA